MFGQFIKELRLKKRISLREFCKKYGHDPSYWSKVERDISNPPRDEKKLEEWAKQLGIEKGSSEWHTFIDLAFTEQGRIPSDIMNNEELVKELPLFFRTLRGEKPSKEEMKKLADLIRRS